MRAWHRCPLPRPLNPPSACQPSEFFPSAQASPYALSTAAAQCDQAWWAAVLAVCRAVRTEVHHKTCFGSLPHRLRNPLASIPVGSPHCCRRCIPSATSISLTLHWFFTNTLTLSLTHISHKHNTYSLTHMSSTLTHKPLSLTSQSLPHTHSLVYTFL